MSRRTASTAGRSRRRAGLAALLVLAAAVLVLGQAARRLEVQRAAQRALPTESGRLAVPGLAAPAELVRDERGVAHVRAASRLDAWRALGVAHAQDRLAQMIWLRRAARGRTAELVGEAGLPADRLARTLGLGRLAEAEAERADARTRRVLEAYAQGVNARMDRIREGRVAPPLALAAVGAPLEAWRPADSIAVSKLLAWNLDARVEESLVLAALIERLGGFGARPFFPPEAAGRLVPGEPEQSVRTPLPGPAFAALRAATGAVGRHAGSSAWVVSPGLTASGGALLAADLHFAPTAPPLLYEAHLEAPGFLRAGATVPGVPLFWAGHNGAVAWAGVHPRVAASDLYEEALHPSDGARYHDGRRWQPLDVRNETLRVRGGAPVALTVRETRHGPLLDGSAEGVAAPLAVGWPGRLPGNAFAALLRACGARDAAGFRQALRDHHEPVLAFVFADREGRGGVQLAGWVPARSVPSGLVPVPGRSRWSAWSERVAFHDLPGRWLDEDGAVRPWLIAADGALGGSEGSRGVEWWWRPGERQARIDALLRQRSRQGALGPLEMGEVQRDVGRSRSRRHADLLEQLAGDPDALPRHARGLLAVLAAWDGEAGASSVGAAAYHAVWVRVARRVLGPPLGEELLERFLRLRMGDPEGVLFGLLAAAAAERPDPSGLVDTAGARRAVRDSLQEAALALRLELGTDPRRWSWGRLHPLRFARFGWPGVDEPRLDGPGPLPADGDGGTLNLGEFDASAPFAVRTAATYRMAADTAELHLVLSALAPGQSEHPGAPTREAGLGPWREGRLTLLRSHPLLVEDGVRARLVLEPVR